MNIMNSKNIPHSSPTNKFSRENSKKILAAVTLATSAIVVEPLFAATQSEISRAVEKYQYPHISGSIDLITLEKVREFMRTKNIAPKQDEQFATEVRALQSRSGLPQDGYLDAATYRAFLVEKNITTPQIIQPKITQKNPENIKQKIQKNSDGMTRAEIKEMYDKYPDPNHLLQKALPNVMSDNYYYGRDAGREIE